MLKIFGQDNMDTNDIIIIGIGDSGSKVADKLHKEGFQTLAIHDGFEVEESEIDCPQINLFDNHQLPENVHFTQSKSNIECLVNENIEEIKKYLLKKQ